jgi:hypothetical protein
MASDERQDPEATLEAAIQRTIPGVESIVYEEDGDHVYVGPVNGAVLCYRLGNEAQQFLLGEFPLEDLISLDVVLQAPEGGGG